MTAQQIARKLAGMGAAVPAEFRKTARGLGISAVRFTREKMTSEIYAIPPDTTAAGKPKWRRTGHLRRSERYEVRSPYVVAIVNDAAYSEPRHEAGKPGRRAINPIRRSHWRDELLKTFRPIVLEANRQTLLALLRRGRN